MAFLNQVLIDPSRHPKEQGDVVGHERAQSQLRQAFYKNALHPVCLLTGERGIGKATMAYALAREFLAHDGQDGRIVARQMAHGSYPNFLVLERTINEDGKIPRELTVDDARKVTAFLRQSAAIPGWRVVIIDAVDEMNRNAANALLKILEEPSAKTIFFLIAHSLGQVLPTIRSRCCQVHLFPLTDDQIIACLGQNVSPDILPLAKGSIGRALALHNAGGMKLLEGVLGAMAGALKADWRPAQSLSGAFDKDNPHFEVLLDLLLWMVHRLILVSHVDPASKVDAHLVSLARLKPMTHWVDVFERANAFLHLARTSHLDRNHVIMSLFFMMENPTSADEFAYESTF